MKYNIFWNSPWMKSQWFYFSIHFRLYSRKMFPSNFGIVFLIHQLHNLLWLCRKLIWNIHPKRKTQKYSHFWLSIPQSSRMCLIVELIHHHNLHSKTILGFVQWGHWKWFLHDLMMQKWFCKYLELTVESRKHQIWILIIDLKFFVNNSVFIKKSFQTNLKSGLMSGSPLSEFVWFMKW